MVLCPPEKRNSYFLSCQEISSDKRIFTFFWGRTPGPLPVALHFCRSQSLPGATPPPPLSKNPGSGPGVCVCVRESEREREREKRERERERERGRGYTAILNTSFRRNPIFACMWVSESVLACVCDRNNTAIFNILFRNSWVSECACEKEREIIPRFIAFY